MEARLEQAAASTGRYKTQVTAPEGNVKARKVMPDWTIALTSKYETWD